MASNVLFIGSDFFGYYKSICKSIEKAGRKVFYFNDRIKSNFFYKSVFRINRKFLLLRSYFYYRNIIHALRDQSISEVLVIEGQSLTPSLIRLLKKGFPKAVFVYVLWDSLANYPYCKKLISSFDHVFSFEKKDCQKYGLIFHPTFFRTEYLQDINNSPHQEPAYFASFIGTGWPEKYNKIKPISESLQEKGYSCFSYFYLSGKWLFVLNKIRYPQFRHAKLSDFSFSKLSDEKVREIYADSSVVLDCPPSGQEGITIRCFEALASGKKVITTNQTIKEYSIYKPENIYVYEGNFDFSSPFFKTPFQKIPESILAFYSIDSWVLSLLY